MSLNAAALQIMADKGLTLQDVAEIAAAMERKADPTAAERAKRYRDNKKAKKTSRRNVTRDAPNEYISNPQGSEAKASSPRADRDFPKPDWAEDQVWSDFKANRRRKGCPNTPTAYKKFLADIDRLSDDEWPPPRLLEHAAAKGWAGIYDPREQKHGKSKSGSRTTDALLAATPDPDEPF